eukprot:ANDGO_02741.mRNA.1 hypothetical protein
MVASASCFHSEPLRKSFLAKIPAFVVEATMDPSVHTSIYQDGNPDNYALVPNQHLDMVVQSLVTGYGGIFFGRSMFFDYIARCPDSVTFEFLRRVQAVFPAYFVRNGQLPEPRQSGVATVSRMNANSGAVSSSSSSSNSSSSAPPSASSSSVSGSASSLVNQDALYLACYREAEKVISLFAFPAFITCYRGRFSSANAAMRSIVRPMFSDGELTTMGFSGSWLLENQSLQRVLSMSLAHMHAADSRIDQGFVVPQIRLRVQNNIQTFCLVSVALTDSSGRRAHSACFLVPHSTDISEDMG